MEERRRRWKKRKRARMNRGGIKGRGGRKLRVRGVRRVDEEI